MKKQSVKSRFERYIMPEPNTGCWLWMARINQKGYGIFGVDTKKHRAHRFSFELYKHAIPKNKLVCHTCDNKWCVNPDHLFIGTSKDNVHDMINKGRASWQKNGATR